MRIRFLAVLVILAIASPVWSTQFRSGKEVSIPGGTTVPDDLFAFSGRVDVAGRIQGDLVASGGNVALSGSTTEGAIIAGGQINVSGKVGDDLLAAGGNLEVSGPIAENATVTGGTVALTGKGSVGRDLTVAGGDVTIDGNVGRNVMANAGTLTIGPNAVIHGNLVYSSGKPATVSPGAKIMGSTIYHPVTHKRANPVARVLFWLGSFAALFIVGVLLIALAPNTAAASADRMRSAPWYSLLIGLIILVVAPVAILISAATLIGLPLALILLAAYLIMLYIARAYAAIGIGRWLFAGFGSPNTSLYVDLLVGMLILWLLMAIPFVGWFIRLIALLLGLGSLAVQRCGMMGDLRREGKL